MQRSGCYPEKVRLLFYAIRRRDLLCSFPVLEFLLLNPSSMDSILPTPSQDCLSNFCVILQDLHVFYSPSILFSNLIKVPFAFEFQEINGQQILLERPNALPI